MQGVTFKGRTSAAVLIAAVALISCGGGDDDKAGTAAGLPKVDPDALVEQSAGPNAKARSGRIDARATVTLQGLPGYAETTTSVSGPFQYRKGSALPDYHLELGARDYGIDLISAGGKSYASLDGDIGYEVPSRVRERLLTKSAKGKNGLMRTLEQFGIAPHRWETERRVTGTERIDGVEVVRIATSFNAGRILKDSNTLLGLLTSIGITRATGLPPQIPHSARKIVVGGVTSKVANTWIGASDKVPRQSGFTMIFKIPKADQAKLGGITGGKVVARLQVTEVGKPQQISAPAKLEPFSSLALALDALGDAQSSR